jgi:hypothetical protein
MKFVDPAKPNRKSGDYGAPPIRGQDSVSE